MISNILLVVDDGGVILESNPAVEKTLGWPASQIGGHTWRDFVHTEDIAGLAAKRNRLARIDQYLISKLPLPSTISLISSLVS